MQNIKSASNLYERKIQNLMFRKEIKFKIQRFINSNKNLILK